jgi:hypothetical protein
MFEVMTPALSIRQPWASLIILHWKDIENRSWTTNVRAPILIHAAKTMTKREYNEAIDFACSIDRGRTMRLLASGVLAFDNMPRGGIIGSVKLVDCVRRSKSPWFVGPNGFVMRDPKPLPFVHFQGKLGFFEIPWGQL